MNEAVHKFEVLCQNQFETLLQEQLRFSEIQTKDVNLVSEDKKTLPYVGSLLPLYEKLDYQEKVLLEIEDKLKQQKQQHELKKVVETASILFDGLDIDNRNPVKKWYREMMHYHREWQSEFKNDIDSFTKDRLFYNMKYSEKTNVDDQLEIAKLSFGTRHCKKCMSLDIEIKIISNEDFEIISCRASNRFEGLSADLDAALRGGKCARDFVENILWLHLKNLADYRLDI